MHEVTSVYQCLEVSINIYFDKCLDIIKQFAEFQIWHIPRHENHKANMLAQQASGYDIGGRNFHIKLEPMHHIATLEAAKPARPVVLCSLADEPARPVCLQVFPGVALKCSLLMLKSIQVIGGLPLLHIYVIPMLRLIKIFGGVLSNLFCTMVNYIGELPKICSLNAWMMIRLEWPWEKSMEAFIVHINRLRR